MRRQSSLAIVFASVLALLGTSAAIAAPTAGDRARVVVVLRDDANPRSAARDAAREHHAEVSFVYEDALRGFAATVPRGRLNGLRNDPRVDYVEPDRIHTIQAQATPTGIRRILADTNDGIEIDGSDDFRVDVDVAVLDTGIDYEHPDLNVVGGQNCLGRWWYASCTDGGDDDYYHGTHVAGTIGALDNGQGVVGVAPGARLWAVKVLDNRGSGYTSEIVAGINWVADNADTIEVANMSLSGSGYNQAEYDAIQGAVDAGVAFAVAAGNSDADANNYSPAAFGNVLTVSALADFNGKPGGSGSSTCRTDSDDTLANFSNWGDAVDITAPGVCIESTYPLEQGGYGTISGTSMASPHAAGALALLASGNNEARVEALYAQVVKAGNFDWTDDSGDGIKEPLLDVSNATLFNPAFVGGGDEGGGGTTNSPPTVSLINPADGATVGGTVEVTADATDDDGVTQVEFIVDEDPVHIDRDGSDGWSASWDTSAVSGGTHAVSATATDSSSLSLTATDEISVTVDNAPTSGIALSVTGYKVKGLQKADLEWSGATSSDVDITRDGRNVATTVNDGAYTDDIDGRGGASYTYRVCEAGTDECSSDVRISF